MAARLYAELLTNIRKVSATIELPTPSNDTTFLAVKSGGFTLHHDGTEQQLKLPGVVDPSYVATKPATGLQQLSCRMPLAPRQTAQPRSLSEGTPVAPWNATDLTSSSRFTCRSCDAVILAENTVTTWQDLPSAHWAEMMDFWHCHKPAVPKTNGNDDGKEDKLQEKGYGASTSFSAQKGVGKVDLMSFLLAEDDIGSAVVLDKADDALSSVARCKSCSAIIGVYEPGAQGYCLNKWALCLPSYSSLSSPPLPYFLIPHLSAVTAALAVSKFVIRDPNLTRESPTNILVWLFAPNLTVSFSGSSQDAAHVAPKPIKAAKLFYQFVSTDEAVALIDKADASVEEVKLHEETVEELKAMLIASTERLPKSASTFGTWAVGVVERD